MTVYVDNMQAKYKGMKMSHMMADTLEELHEMADKIGMKREWFQDKKRNPHYDVSMAKRALAVKFGAREVTPMELVKLTRKPIVREEDKINMSCSICLTSVSDTPLFRNNPKGEKAVWRCRKHLDKKPEPETEAIVRVLCGNSQS